MALYGDMANNRSRAFGSSNNSRSSLASMSKENQTTEIEPARMTPMQGMNQAMSFMSLPGQVKRIWDGGKEFVDWGMSKLGAPNAEAQAAQAGAGAATDLSGGVQMNTGATVAEAGANAVASSDLYEGMAQGLPDEIQKELFFGNPENLVPDTAGNLAGGTGGIADTGAGIADGTANNVAAETAVQTSQGGMSTLGATIAPAAGGVMGGMAGKAIGKAIGGETGGDIGGVVGSMGGAYLGSLAGSALTTGLGTAAGAGAGAAAGATAGSVVPGLGTVIGAGIGALTSFLL